MSSVAFPSRLALLAGLALSAAAALASPGAHGPNGEHLDGPVATSAGSGQPRVEAFSEAFEIVGRLDAAGLLLYVNRYETSEAVLRAKVEVELDGVKAPASFQVEGGSYRVGDAKLLELLRKPGNHTLLFTVAAGADADLLDGPMAVVAPEAHDGGHPGGTGLRNGLMLAGGGVATLAVVAALRRRNRA
ncbi:hypothetical protein [Roseateles sp.]|uniref:hypothetical protein n=1 Tax=Roseateles sp. TaxID=1971397 RepID=UPI003BAC4477